MHKQRVNELFIHLLIEPAGPILIKSGIESGADPTLPSMNFVRTHHPRTGTSTIYLPGASLKGVIRSHCERIIRTVRGDAPDVCCDPLDFRHNCGSRTQKISDTAAQYQALCYACRIFGHTTHASHFFISDAYPRQPIDTLPVRQNVAIDRLSGGVAVGPFDMEVAQEGQFVTRLMLTNFELWQVGLLALALRDMAEGRVRLGFAKSRGLGEIQLRLARLEVAYPGQFGSDSSRFASAWVGVGALLPAQTAAAYGFVSNGDQVPFATPGEALSEELLWGRPGAQFGLPAQTLDRDDAELPGLAQAHQEILQALQPSVRRWVELQP